MLINQKTLKELVADLGADVFPQLIDIYVSDTKRASADIIKDFNAGKYDDLAREVHSQKAVAATYGTDDLLQKVLPLNEKLKNKVPLADLETEVKELSALMLKTADAMQHTISAMVI